MSGLIEQLLAKKAVELALSVAKRAVEVHGARLAVQPWTLERAVEDHVSNVATWAEEVSFKDLAGSKLTSQVYIPLDVYLYPKKLRVDEPEQIEARPIADILQETAENIVLAGQPGAGKTTSMKWLVAKLLRDSDFLADRFDVPLLIRFRALESSPEAAGGVLPIRTDAITYTLWHLLGLAATSTSGKELSETARQQLSRDAVASALEQLRALVILEGFDELTDVAKRRSAVSDLNFYAERLSKARFILTTRTGEFNIRLPNTRDFEIAPLSKAQLQKFALQWLGDERKATDLIDQIEKSPFADTALRPLTLAHLCAIFERVGRIPPKPKTVYRKVVALLLEEWDEQRGIERLSKYANFELDRRMEFLAHLAFELTLSPGSGEFSTERLKQVYGRICGNFDLDRSQAKKVVAELESHHGLFLESGFQRYQFAHKSLQEFLAAEYIVRLPALLTDPKTLLRLPNELAIATSISSNSSLYLSNFVFQVLVRAQLPREFYETFITRLVQEKPEFYSERYVVFALAVLYSKYIETGFVEKGGQLALFSFDEILQECERFLELVAKRNVPSIIFEYYKSDHQFSLLDGTKLVELKRVHRLQQVALPETLFLREQFLPSEVK